MVSKIQNSIIKIPFVTYPVLKENIIYIFYSTTRIGQEFPFSQPTGPKYYMLLPEIIVPEKQTQKLRKSAKS